MYSRPWMGELLADTAYFESVFVRFCSKITLDDFTGCWLWGDALNRKGYGNLHVKRQRPTAHGVAYVLMVGPIPEGLTVDHTCENPSCVNPDHLLAMTNRENTMKSRGPEKAGQHNKVKTHCPRGHEYTPETTELGRKARGSVSRGCKVCRQISGDEPITRAHNNRSKNV